MQTIPETTPDKFVNYMLRLLTKLEPKDITSQMLWGMPGSGKSDSIRQLIDALNKYFKERLIKKIAILTDIRLPMYAPVDLRGMPAVREGFAEWLRPKVLDLKETMEINGETYKVINIFFMDEISAALPSVQVCAYQITNDRQVGEHKLPDNTLPLLAGNRVTDKSVAFEMSKALANRLTHWEMKLKAETWFDWAYANDIDPLIIAFLHFKPNLFNTFMVNGTVTNDLAFATGRSWANANKYLKVFDNLDDAIAPISGTIGMGPTNEFAAFARVKEQLPTIADLATGKFTTQTRDASVNWSIISMICANVKHYNQANFENVITFLNNMPIEFTTIGGKEMLTACTRQGRLPQLLQLNAWKNWLALTRTVLN